MQTIEKVRCIPTFFVTVLFMYNDFFLLSLSTLMSKKTNCYLCKKEINLNDPGVATYEDNQYACPECFEKVLTKIVQDDQGRSIYDYTKAIEKEPQNAKNYYLRGCLYSVFERFDDTIEDLTSAIELDPSNIEYYVARGDAYSVSDQLYFAVEDYSTAIDLNPQVASLYAYRADLFRDMEDFDSAINDYTIAIEQNSDAYYEYEQRGDVYCELQLFDLAIADYTALLQKAPNSKAVYLKRAEAYRKVGDDDNATKDEEKAKTIKED